MRPAERHADGGVAENAVADRALLASAEIVSAGRRVHQRAAEILAGAEWPFDPEAPADLGARSHLGAALHGHVAGGVAIARARTYRPALPHLERGREPGRHAAT